jgi:ABC-type multidrug transport system fused ATPase/permease subunit
MTAEKPASIRLFFFYGGLCRKVLLRRALFSGFVVAAALHGIGHCLMAMAASSLGTAFVANSLPSRPIFGVSLDPASLALVGVLATAIKGAGATVGATLQSRLSQNVASWIRKDLAARLLAAGSRLPAGQLAARLSVGLREVERGVEEGMLGGIKAVMALLPLGIALGLVSSPLAWGAALLLVPFGLLLSLARTAWKRSYVRALAAAEGVHQEVDELVAHIDVWRTYGAAEPVDRSLEELGAQAAAASGRAEGARAALSSANEVLAALTLLACVFGARWLAMPLADGTIVAFAVPFFMAYRPLRDLGDARTAMERGAAALASLEATARTVDGTPRGSGVATPRARGVDEQSAIAPRTIVQSPRRWQSALLEVDDVGVVRSAAEVGEIGREPTAGEGGARTSFVVRPGEIVAIVGPTGSGKTTLLRALLGLEPGATGSIRYGGAELARAGVGPSMRPFAWAPQEAPVLAGSLHDNVLLVGRDDRAVAAVLRSIGAERLLIECHGATLGASGRPVSGGERKWIAIARAIASELPVLLLDEPMAGLDAAAQNAVLATLHDLRRTHAIVVVTHQRDAARWADRVVPIGTRGDDQNWASSRGSFSKNRRTSGMS